MKYLKFALLLLSLQLFAQTTKVGTVDIDFILSKMPELEGVQEQVGIFSKGLDGQLQQRAASLEAEVLKYKNEEGQLTIKQKQSRQDSLIAMETSLKQFQQNGNQLVLAKQEELLQPLYSKIGAALEKVAKAGEYTQILQRTNDLVYIDNRFDLTKAILKELGIEIKEE